MRGVRPSWALLPSVLALLASMNRCKQGPEMASSLTGGVLTQPLAKTRSSCMPDTAPSARETKGSKNNGYARESPYE